MHWYPLGIKVTHAHPLKSEKCVVRCRDPMLHANPCARVLHQILEKHNNNNNNDNNNNNNNKELLKTVIGDL